MQIITTHKNTDFDGLASVIAGTVLYPGSIGIIPKNVNNNVDKFLSTHKTAFNIALPNEVEHDKVNHLIVMDTDQWRRLDRMEKLRDRDDLKITLFDHHKGGDIHGDIHHQEYIGATVTLLVREMKRQDISLSPLISTVMLLGLYEDTGHLTYRSTTPEDAYAAAYLLENGADLNVASVFLNPPYEEMQKEVLFEMMRNTHKTNIHNHSVAVNIIPLQRKVTNLASVVNMYRKIINVTSVFIIFINDEKSSTIIARSGSDMIDVGSLMKSFGGGGHQGAGSATVKTKEYSPEALREELLKRLEGQQLEGAKIADIMSFPVTQVAPDMPMHDVQKIMAREKIRGILVTEGEDILGIVVLWDFKKIRKENQWKSPVKAFMSRQVTSIGPGDMPVQAAEIMAEKNIGHLPVVHKEKLIGIVTRTDVLTYFYGILPD